MGLLGGTITLQANNTPPSQTNLWTSCKNSSSWLGGLFFLSAKGKAAKVKRSHAKISLSMNTVIRLGILIATFFLTLDAPAQVFSVAPDLEVSVAPDLEVERLDHNVYLHRSWLATVDFGKVPWARAIP